MKEIELQFNFSNASPELVNQIKEAIDNGQPFGLTNGRVTSIFDPARLRGAFSGGGRTYLCQPAQFNYNSLEHLFQGVSLAMLSCKQFIKGTNLVTNPTYRLLNG